MNARTLLLTTLFLTPLPLAAQQHPVTTMPAFASDSALYRYLRRMVAERERRSMRREQDAVSSPMAMAAAPGEAQGAGMDAITNVQHAGVDEGDIVKLHGNLLVILRRGRLFTVEVGGHTLRPAGMSDAFGAGIDPGGTWYDEMLISGDKVVVIGYSYSRGGTEAGIFRLQADGSLQYLATFQLRSNDYYSSRNYASRLIGSKLIFYAPLYLPMDTASISDAFPALRRWNNQRGDSGFVPIIRGERTFRPAGWLGSDNAALHTVTSCDLAAPQVTCRATVVVGPPGRVFYVSPSAVYVWMTEWSSSAGRRANMLARLPLDGSRPTAQRVSGSPADQFSFLERDGYINVLTLGGSNGEQMWDGEQQGGPVSLLRLPLDSLGDGSRWAAPWSYRRLPSVQGGTFQNRFAGDYVLYGTGSGWGGEEASSKLLMAVPYRGGDARALRLVHGTDRIEVMGNDAVVVGVRDTNLEFTGIRLGDEPRIAQRFTMANASQGELRSHGFFYRMDGPGGGMIGLPVREAARPGWVHLVEGSASVMFLKNTGGRFQLAGKLSAGEVRNSNDACRASCVDWYGNARPIFARGRTYALMGYELVEGEMRDGVMQELQRVNFAPARMTAARN